MKSSKFDVNANSVNQNKHDKIHKNHAKPSRQYNDFALYPQMGLSSLFDDRSAPSSYGAYPPYYSHNYSELSRYTSPPSAAKLGVNGSNSKGQERFDEKSRKQTVAQYLFSGDEPTDTVRRLREKLEAKKAKKKSKNNTENKGIIISANEESIINEMKEMKKKLNQEISECDNDKNGNKFMIQENVEKLEKMKIFLKKTIDDTMNQLIENLKNEGSNEEKANDILKNELVNKLSNLKSNEIEFNKFLKNKSKMTKLEKDNYMKEISKKIKNENENSTKETNTKSRNINVINNINCKQMEKYIKTEINENFEILDNDGSENNNENDKQ